MAAKRNKKSASISSLILPLVAGVGMILTIVGICIDWFAATGSLMGSSSTPYTGLFADGLDAVDFPIAAVQAFAIMGVIFAAFCCAAAFLQAFGVFKLKSIAKIVLAALTFVISVLALVFAFVYIGEYGAIDGGEFASLSWSVAAGAYLLGIGGAISGIALLLQRKA